MDRRHFLGAGASLWGSSHLWAQASDRVRVAIIGLGGRGKDHLNGFSSLNNVEVGALVEPDGKRAEEAASLLFKKTGKRARIESDMRRIFEDKSIDAVTIATTNHWHALSAIWAMQAGKDVYVEKPVSHNFFEGQKLVEAARKYNRIVQGGTQRRSMGRFRKLVELIHDGVIGEVYQGKFVFPGRRDSIGFKPVEPPPSWLNWDLWLGPALDQPYHANLVHYNWHWFWDFGNGELGNNGIHLVDVSRWAMRKDLPVKVHCSGGRFGYKDQAQTPNTQMVTWQYADGATIIGELRGLYTAEPMSWDFFGSKGHMHVFADGKIRIVKGRNKEAEPEVEPLAEINHFENFTDAVRSRDRSKLNAEIRETHISTALCHLGNISYRMGRELQFDTAQEKFVNQPEADKLLRREYRAPYVVPDKV
ncbi:MAG: Gfo/Idh/MocA family oxidoreductase [Bryobacteraceae bacterium]|nr:Gfo/Idh/MocA family oxidoreductase [Bryobacteraceae bacterium]